MTEVHGTCDERFAAMRDLMRDNLETGTDVGASVAVTLNGKLVVDLWGGWADAGRTSPWGEHTITNVWSTTKTMTSLAALVLVDRGKLDVFAPVARYWPEFAAKGKEAVEVRHLLSHTSGVSGWELPVVMEDIYDWEKSTAKLAGQAPWWAPGTASGYHAFNQGHLVGEVIRRITGMKLGEFFAEEIAGPLGADFHIGLDPKHFNRIGNVIPPPPLPFDFDTMDKESPAYKTFMGPAADARCAWTEAWRRADIGAANGHGNARSVAKLQAFMACGGKVDGVRLLSPATCELALQEQSNGVDLVLGQPIRFGIGYGLPHESLPHIPSGRICWWGGWGGSLIVVDQARRMTVAYVMNRMGPGTLGDTRGAGFLKAAISAADQG